MKTNKIIWDLLIIALIIIGPLSYYYFNHNDSSNKEEQVKKEEKTTMNYNVKITIDDKEYITTLEENNTTKELIKKLPLKLNLKDLNSNEKYVNLDYSLPTESYNPNKINKGDLMLYNNNCIVLFYKSFDTEYSYTKLGHIDNLSELNDEIVLSIEAN